MLQGTPFCCSVLAKAQAIKSPQHTLTCPAVPTKAWTIDAPFSLVKFERRKTLYFVVPSPQNIGQQTCHAQFLLLRLACKDTCNKGAAKRFAAKSFSQSLHHACKSKGNRDSARHFSLVALCFQRHVSQRFYKVPQLSYPNLEKAWAIDVPQGTLNIMRTPRWHRYIALCMCRHWK